MSFLARVGIAAILVSGVSTPLSFRTAPRMSFGSPEIIIFHDGILKKPIAVATWAETQWLLVNGKPDDSVIPDTKFYLGTRPRIELALFWGSGWREVARIPGRLAALTPAEANQAGTFYPALPGAPAIIAVGSIVSTMSDSGLAVLRRHGIPVTMPRSRVSRPSI